MATSPGEPLPPGRYRRRILGWGALALALVLAIGSAVSLARVEDDLDRRTTRALVDAGAVGIAVSFSGQDGTVSCEQPLDDPQGMLDAGAAVRGVRGLTLDESCTTADDRPLDQVAPDDALEPPPTATTSTVVATSRAPATTSTTQPAETTVPDPTDVLDILVDDPQFTVLRNAVGAVDLDGLLGGPGPLTVFAPTDDAFAALGPNFNAALASDPDALLAVLRHHISTSMFPAAELTAGSLTMIDGTTLEIETGAGLRVVSGTVGATVIDPDLDAANGVVHVIDQVLLPEGLDIGVVADVFTAVARFEDGRLTFSGTVASDGDRRRLLEAAEESLAPENVVDQLVVDGEMPPSAEEVGALAALAAALPVNLVVGEVVVGSDGLFVSGIHVDDAARTTIDGLAADLGAVTGLTERPVATASGAAALEDQLNELVAAEPIRFEPGSADLAPSAPAILDRVAAIAKSLGGISVTVEGHTDSDGLAETNLILSADRAEAVRAALVARGVPAGDLLAEGFGSTRPILVDGVEDKAASRRVEFVVVRE